jgi:hypothetical protein
MKTQPIRQIREVMLRCPDDRPSSGTQDLVFIGDSELREEIRRDISAANSALQNAEWKGAAVLAGSVAEALLLWVIELHKKARPYEVGAAIQKVKSKPTGAPENWGLGSYIEVAAELELISPGTSTQAKLTQDFRNLIHPGRAKRLAQKSDRATALSAMAGMEHLIRDLSKHDTPVLPG